MTKKRHITPSIAFFCYLQVPNTPEGPEYETYINTIWATTWDFQQCGMCDQQSLRSACAYAQSDQSLC